jgi:hypothetical protein
VSIRLQILRKWKKQLPEFVLRSNLLLREKGKITQAIGIQKNRFDNRNRINLAILLKTPDYPEGEVLLFAHLCRDGVRTSADESMWREEPGSPLVIHQLRSVAVPWLDEFSNLAVLLDVFEESIRSLRTPAEVVQGITVSRLGRVVPPMYFEIAFSLASYLGKHDKACAYLERVRNSNPGKADQLAKLLPLN